MNKAKTNHYVNHKNLMFVESSSDVAIVLFKYPQPIHLRAIKQANNINISTCHKQKILTKGRNPTNRSYSYSF